MLGIRELWLCLAVICLCASSALAGDSDEEQFTDTTTEAGAKEDCPPALTIVAPPELQIPRRTCMVQESKVSELMIWMSAVLRMLNTDHDYAESRKVEVEKLSELQRYEMCSEHRIEMLTEELRWASRRLWELSIRLEDPAEAEVKLLDKRKVDLIRHLQNIRVYTGNSAPTWSQRAFDIQVDYLDYGFNTALTMFHNPRPTRSPSLGTSRMDPVLQSILDPNKSKSELIEISRDQPSIMTEALPTLVSNRYAGNLKNVRLLLDFIKDLPKVVHQMLGYVSLYDTMSLNSDLESYELTELVLQLKGINSSVTSAADDVPYSLMVRYTELVDYVWPVYQIVGRDTSCEFRNLKYKRSMDGGSSLNHLNEAESDRSSFWSVVAVPGTAMFTTNSQWYSSANDVFSASKRSVKYRVPVSEIFGQWKLVPVKSGKYFKILNAKYDEVMFADKTEMNPSSANHRRIFLARHDYPHAFDFEADADLWIIDCK